MFLLFSFFLILESPYLPIFFILILLVSVPITKRILIAKFNIVPYNGLFSQGANFPEFSEWPHNLGKFMLGCFFSLIVDCKEYRITSKKVASVT